MGQAILLTGRPGVGKTTLIRELSKALHHSAGGFYTDEIREGGRRRGFKIVTLAGEEGVLAHEEIKAAPHVGRYGVNLTDLEEMVVSAIQEAVSNRKYIIIDEIGKMELTSPHFQRAVQQALASPKTVVATIMVAPHPFADQVKKGRTVLEVTLANREGLKERILSMLAEQA